MTETKVIVGGSLEEDAVAFLHAWNRAERGERVDESAIAFESWEALASVMTGERYRLLRHLHAHPEPSVSALARALGRQYRRVHADVAALGHGPQEILLGSQLGIQRTMIDHIVAMKAAGLRFGYRRQVAMGNAEVTQISDQRGRIFEIEFAMELEPVGSARNCGAHIGDGGGAPWMRSS
jgi:hypothetical protein